MPELIEQMYCSRQIVIPPKFPYILKRYAKAAIKTQPYDLLRWSFEYFKALAEDRTPPVKLRLEYPVFNTEGGLTKGYLKVLACQLEGLTEIPQSLLRTVWCGSCLDLLELKRILCLCEVYNELSVKKLHFIAVAGGLLTKCLTHTMILLCETLSKEPEGGSAAIPVEEFLMMYRFLALMDASKDVPYIDGYREGLVREKVEEEEEEEEEQERSTTNLSDATDGFWQDTQNLQRLHLTNDLFDRSARLSVKMTLPPIGHISRSPSAERAGQIERDNFTRDRKGRPETCESIDKQLHQMGSVMATDEVNKDTAGLTQRTVNLEEEESKVIKIVVTDEDGENIPWQIYGDPDDEEAIEIEGDLENPVQSRKERVAAIYAQYINDRELRIADLYQTFSELADIVTRFKSANYDLGMVAGRQMSTTSGEFIVQHIERDIMAVVDEQIAVLPDPDLKKRRAKPQEVMMIRGMVDLFVSENLKVIVHEDEEVEEEEVKLPEIITVYAVPGIGQPVDRELMREFEEYARDVAGNQADVIMPRNIRHYLCPPLERFVEHDYQSNDFKSKEEEVPTGGVITE